MHKMVNPDSDRQIADDETAIFDKVITPSVRSSVEKYTFKDKAGNDVIGEVASEYPELFLTDINTSHLEVKERWLVKEYLGIGRMLQSIDRERHLGLKNEIAYFRDYAYIHANVDKSFKSKILELMQTQKFYEHKTGNLRDVEEEVGEVRKKRFGLI